MEGKSYLVLHGFTAGKIDEVTGDGLEVYNRGDLVVLDAETAATELQRNRVADADVDPDRIASVRAAVRAELGDDAVFRDVT